MPELKHCRHCTDPDSPAHDNPGFREAEENCAYYGPSTASEFLHASIALRRAARAFTKADEAAAHETSEERADAFAALVSAADYYLSLAKELVRKRRRLPQVIDLHEQDGEQ